MEERRHLDVLAEPGQRWSSAPEPAPSLPLGSLFHLWILLGVKVLIDLYLQITRSSIQNSPLPRRAGSQGYLSTNAHHSTTTTPTPLHRRMTHLLNSRLQSEVKVKQALRSQRQFSIRTEEELRCLRWGATSCL